jgi:DNA excision repair protein ERCC-2
MEKSLRLSVHQLVDFLLRSGDIDNRVFNRSSMTEGSRLHSVYQSKQSANYMSEYPLSINLTVDEIDILLEGRADGIIKRSDGTYVIDEIKTTVEELEKYHADNLEWHLGQAKCYAYMFAKLNDLDFIGIKLTYIRQGKEKEQLVDSYTFNILELEQFVVKLLNEYLSFYNIIFNKISKRNESIEALKFPFSKFRQGQRDLAKYTYAMAKKRGRLFAEAPTGIGKTISTLFPFIKALKDDDNSKIFYLTAKTSGRESAHQAVKLLKEHGLSLSDIMITAKDKICFCKGQACNPEECPYAKGYYNKIQTVLRYAILNYDDFDLQTITQLAYENQICPFEFELDLSLFMDVIICDYNYLFDPISYMKRYFDEDTSSFLVLVDEAHNLVDRSRDMYSASLSYKQFLEARKSVCHSKLHQLKLAMSKMNKMFKEYLVNPKDGNYILDEFYEYTYKTISSFITSMQDINKNENKEMSKELLEFYLEVNRFSKILEFYNDHFICYYEIHDDDLILHVSCLDASSFLYSSLRRLRGSVLFSATLSPIEYYVDMLGGKKEDAQLILPSPFPVDNLKIIIAPKVSIRYKNRDASYQQVADYIKAFVKNKVGNYFIFLPSYEYLTNLMPYIDMEDVDVYEQDRGMSDEDKEAFLTNFKPHPERTTLGFVIVGGAFGEGIDLVSDRLIGAVIVGIGMPKINFVSDQIMKYYDSKEQSGYNYAYLNPGMNKVMQALGRVIRSETDRGAVLLIDERYLTNDYRDLFKSEWRKYEVAFSPKEVSDILQDFFIK